MKLNTLLEYLLREASERPAPEGSPLGQYLFAPSRSDVPYEENEIPLEDELEDDLISHYAGTGNISKIERSLRYLKSLEQKGLYTKLLDPPSGVAYRYVSGLTPEEASKMFLNGYPVEDIVETPNVAFVVSNIGTVKNPAAKSTVARGYTTVSSWTLEPELMAFAGFISTEQDKVSILLVADIDPQTFLMNPEALSDVAEPLIAKASVIDFEQEVIAIGPVNVSKAVVIYTKAAALSEEEIKKIRAQLPAIELPEISEEESSYFADGAEFAPAFYYVETVIHKYKQQMDNQTFSWLLTHDEDYTNLRDLCKHGLELSVKNISDTSSVIYRYKSIAKKALNKIIESIKYKRPSPETIQISMLKAINKA